MITRTIRLNCTSCLASRSAARRLSNLSTPTHLSRPTITQLLPDRFPFESEIGRDLKNASYTKLALFHHRLYNGSTEYNLKK